VDSASECCSQLPHQLVNRLIHDIQKSVIQSDSDQLQCKKKCIPTQTSGTWSSLLTALRMNVIVLKPVMTCIYNITDTERICITVFLSVYWFCRLVADLTKSPAITVVKMTQPTVFSGQYIAVDDNQWPKLRAPELKWSIHRATFPGQQYISVHVGSCVSRTSDN